MSAAPPSQNANVPSLDRVVTLTGPNRGTQSVRERSAPHAECAYRNCVELSALLWSGQPVLAAWHWIYGGNGDCSTVPVLLVLQGSTSPSSFEMARVCQQNYHPYPANTAVCSGGYVCKFSASWDACFQNKGKRHRFVRHRSLLRPAVRFVLMFLIRALVWWTHQPLVPRLQSLPGLPPDALRKLVSQGVAATGRTRSRGICRPSIFVLACLAPDEEA